MSNGHAYAALMLQYAQDANETKTPWLRWEFKDPIGSNTWSTCETHPRWWTSLDYRRKPQTVTVNGFDVPKPLENIEAGQVVWFSDPTLTDWAGEDRFVSDAGWPARGVAWQKMLKERKLYHANKEDAVAYAKAMAGIDPAESAQ